VLAAGTVLVLLCAAAFILVRVLVVRERQSIAQARAVLEPFRATCAPEELARIQAWIDWRVGEGSSRPPVMVRGSYFPGLLRRPWHDAEAFAWERELQAALPKVREELLAVYGANKEGFRKYNYPGSADKNWKVFPLFRDHQKVEAHCARCPETTRLVEHLTGGLTRDVMVSLLEPNAYIAPHKDSGNLFLTGHYGLVVPEECGLRVGEETRVWSEGRSLLFDTSFEHEAWNRGGGIRMVLLYEFLHPDMSAVERRYFSALFQVGASQREGSQSSGTAMQGAA
jgi:aspartyl/asparaginyl beta-hydroxylase (cupin superfamily)